MEDIPPSYDQSINPSVLDLVAPYLDTLSLHALTLVSRSYNEAFAPYLWGSPASHFVPLAEPTLPGVPRQPQASGSYDDMVYVALTRFKRVIKRARYSTRCLVHTLYLPPALSEIYGGPNATWLREILDWLPNLQSLCVGGLPFFDHHSLIAVDKQKSSTPNEGSHIYPLKLLLAAKEPNATSIGLSLFLPHVSNLVYLDLSYTTPARDMNVLSSLAALSDLQILKLRGIGLRDPEAEVLANAIGLRVRLLDVAENLLSDMAVRSLLQACFVHAVETSSDGRNGNRQQTGYHTHNASRQLESWPVGLPPAPDYLSLDTLRSSDFDKNLLVQLTNPLTGRLAFEDIPHGGLTHLYITGNPAVTIEGIRSLLDTGRLHVLDAGEVAGETVVDKYVKSAINTGRWRERTRSMTTGSRSFDLDMEDDASDIHFPGAEKLIPVLREKASNNLTYLRIDHAIVTKEIDIVVTEKPPVEIAGDMPSQLAELSAQIGVTQFVEAPGSNHLSVEMPSDQIHELDSIPLTRVELPGDPIHFALTPPVGDKPFISEAIDIPPKPIRGEGAYAPEVVHDGDNPSGDDEDNEIVLDATGSGIRRLKTNSTSSPVSPMSNIAGHCGGIDAVVNSTVAPLPNQPQSPPDDRATQAEALIRLRPKKKSPQLHPASLPNLRTLILTNVPSQVAAKSPGLKMLKDFITACAAEDHLALLRSKTNYSLPPGRARAAAERKHARSLFALRTIVLEVVPVLKDASSQRDWKHTGQRLNLSKSSAGDRDSEALWSAAENDFSFFGEEGEEHEECGIYDHEPSKYFPRLSIDEKFSVMPEDASSAHAAAGRNSSMTGYTDSRPLTPMSGIGTVFKSPRELPLGRNRRSSSEAQRASPPTSEFAMRMGEGRLSTAELPGPFPSSPPAQQMQFAHRQSITSAPTLAPAPKTKLKPDVEVVMVDVVAELSKFRRERKALYEEKIRRSQRASSFDYTPRSSSFSADSEIYVEGHWKGEIKVIRTSGKDGKKAGNPAGGSKGRLERTGMVDIYGNYFEKGYLYS